MVYGGRILIHGAAKSDEMGLINDAYDPGDEFLASEAQSTNGICGSGITGWVRHTDPRACVRGRFSFDLEANANYIIRCATLSPLPYQTRRAKATCRPILVAQSVRPAAWWMAAQGGRTISDAVPVRYSSVSARAERPGRRWSPHCVRPIHIHGWFQNP